VSGEIIEDSEKAATRRIVWHMTEDVCISGFLAPETMTELQHDLNKKTNQTENQ